MRAAVVVTSIYDCSKLFEGYLENFAKYGRDVDVFLIVDRKTPKMPVSRRVRVVTIEEQLAFLTRIGFPSAEIPFDSDNRRNVGYLMALESGVEMIVSIDDDNFCRDDVDFIGEHAVVLEERRAGLISQSSWFNNCAYVDKDVFPRGLPYYAKQTADRTIKRKATRAKVRINSGLWVGDPDLDAITWITTPRTAKQKPFSVMLGKNSWCPINSQNTAISRELMGAYWFVRMDAPMDRFGDIFQGYFVLKVAKKMGWTARFGSPMVDHLRNSHVYMKDIAKEIGPIMLIEELLPKLTELKLAGTTVGDVYMHLAEFIERQGTDVYREMARRMRLWSATCARLNG